jgi:hypothetical protein
MEREPYPTPTLLWYPNVHPETRAIRLAEESRIIVLIGNGQD